MKLKYYFFLFILGLSLIGKAQNDKLNISQNLFTNPPDSIPKIFAKGIISVQDRYEYGLAISPNYDEIFFTAESPGDGLMVMKKLDNESWSDPKVANLRGNNSEEFEAFYTSDGQKLYFASLVNDTSRLWFSEKEKTTWSTPKLLESPVNDTPVFWATFTNTNTMYYTNLAVFKIYKSEPLNGQYPTTKFAGIPYGIHPTVSKDESFILFNYRRDLYVAFRNSENKWGDPIKFDDTISSSEFSETCPCLSPDEKYIFFSRYNDTNNKSDIYWVSTDIIKNLKPN
ncbi:MAG: hypothetical protein HN778_14245 [Prolixibacteraceae bacterium]|jgi:hypothetical protein|nr:hypothetical protein [Prolixibacteraceae bacterium]MBT6007244.1 hypothetical protein [Prolixibacteraceae bacterium]MBT6835414.1 hypothetical protein [Bacteroidota bacterium]MBT6998003.1 hypothetical protein [Prolixibacteraceae bacterium]MBT7395987.1 hypothetical protein [Prolixibacteraceae bacterium]